MSQTNIYNYQGESKKMAKRDTVNEPRHGIKQFDRSKDIRNVPNQLFSIGQLVSIIPIQHDFQYQYFDRYYVSLAIHGPNGTMYQLKDQFGSNPQTQHPYKPDKHGYESVHGICLLPIFNIGDKILLPDFEQAEIMEDETIGKSYKHHYTVKTIKDNFEIENVHVYNLKVSVDTEDINQKD